MSRPTALSPWLSKPRLNPRARLRLFCLPYAGGNAMTFRRWPELLPSTVDVCPVQLPGRGERLREPAYTRVGALVKDLSQALRPYLDRPFAFFGHSMGALISFELARLLRREAGPEPLHLLVSGRRAPQLPDTEPPRHDLPEQEFLDELRRLNGTPKEVLEHQELMLLMMPLLRADFELSETYSYAADAPLSCPITAFGGTGDLEVGREQLEAWKEQTRAAFNLRMFEGDHFYLHQAEALLARAIFDELRQHDKALG